MGEIALAVSVGHSSVRFEEQVEALMKKGEQGKFRCKRRRRGGRGKEEFVLGTIGRR